jgi:hypothetical protein
LSPEALQHLPYQFELKCSESVSVWSAIQQLSRRADPSLTPCVVLGRNHARPIAVVPLGHWCNLLQAQSLGTHHGAGRGAAAPVFPNQASYKDFVKILGHELTAAPPGGAAATPPPAATTSAAAAVASAGAACAPTVLVEGQTVTVAASESVLVEGTRGAKDTSASKRRRSSPAASVADREDASLAWLTARAWPGERAELHSHGVIRLDDGTLGSWIARVWTKPRFNVWRVWEEAENASARAMHNSLLEARAAARRAAKNGNDQGPSTVATTVAPLTPPLQRPLVVFGLVGSDDTPIFASMHFDVWLSTVAAQPRHSDECAVRAS